MTLRPSFMVSLIIAVHALDFATFWLALAVFGVPISAEQNVLMAGSYLTGGFAMVFVTELALVAIGVSLLARVRTRPVWPLFLILYGLGIVGTAANLSVIHQIGGI